MSAVVEVRGPDLGPFSSISSLIDRQFRDVVGRPPSEHETNTWLQGLRTGQVRPVDLVADLRGSDDNHSNIDPSSGSTSRTSSGRPTPAG